MGRNFSIYSIIVGLVSIGFGILMAVKPPESLETYPGYIRTLFVGMLLLYGVFRLVRATMDLRR